MERHLSIIEQFIRRLFVLWSRSRLLSISPSCRRRRPFNRPTCSNILIWPLSYSFACPTPVRIYSFAHIHQLFSRIHSLPCSCILSSLLPCSNIIARSVHCSFILHCLLPCSYTILDPFNGFRPSFTNVLRFDNRLCITIKALQKSLNYICYILSFTRFRVVVRNSTLTSSTGARTSPLVVNLYIWTILAWGQARSSGLFTWNVFLVSCCTGDYCR